MSHEHNLEIKAIDGKAKIVKSEFTAVKNRLELSIQAAKPNMDKIKDVDEFLKEIQ